MAEEAQAQVAQNQEKAAHAEKMEVFNETAIRDAELEREREAASLPDDDKAALDSKAENDKKEEEWQEKLKAAEKERETSEKRLRDTQHKMHMMTAEKKENPAPETEQKPKATFNEYVEGIVKTFEDAPADAVKKIIQDFAADRDTMRRQNQQELSQLKESLIQEVFMSQPDNAKHMAMVAELDTARPDMKNLSTKQKLEFVKLMDAASEKGKKKESNDNSPEIDRNLLSGTTRNAVKSNGLPDWLNHPDVQKEATGKFKSKREILDWLDPEKALAMAKEAAKKREE